MYYYEVAPTQIVRAGSNSFTYGSEVRLHIGQLVRVSVGSKSMNGVIIAAVAKRPSYDVKLIDTVLDETPLPPAYIKLAAWLSEYYVTAYAVVLQTMLPSGLHKNRRVTTATPSVNVTDRTHFVLNDEQSQAVTQIHNAGPGTVLLHGITGSGKTAVYIELAARAVAAGKSVIILVPEIALTSQVVNEFARTFPSVLLTHSRQTEAQRHSVWLQALHASTPQVIIGPRSALFLPVQQLGLIVIDEAHEPSYKQEQSPRYNALRAAHYLAAQSDATVVLGSATPLVSDYFVAQATNRPIITMNRLAVSGAHKPAVRIIDMTKRSHFKRHRFLSDDALIQIEQDLAANKQVLVFHNRRGSAPTTLCENCGWQAGCPKCFVPLTLHGDTHELRCHICNFSDRVPTSCPQCHHASIIHKGIGTKLIESELTKLFSKSTIARFDGDTHQSQTVEQRYDELKSGAINIIIGTQVIAKGLDLPHLHSVVVVQADAGLSLPDYSSAERTFQLLAQVIGRVGRSKHDTNVIVQSYQPTHPVITYGLAQDYAGFYELALLQRKRSTFPPFTFLLKLQCAYKTEAVAIRNAQTFSKQLRTLLPPDVEILGPTPAFYERAGDMYRWQLVLKSPKREHLVRAVRHLPPSHWQFELDPISLL